MCRFVAYGGQPIVLKDIILDVPHSIFKQSFDAKEMLSGHMNGDGFGVAWYERSLSDEPAVYVATAPIWADYNIGRIADKIRSGIIFAHVRGASEGMPIAITNTHPFSVGRFTFMHNGSVDDFRTVLFPDIVPFINTKIWERIKGNTDSEHLFAWWLTEVYAATSSHPTLQQQKDALSRVIEKLTSLASKAGTEFVLNLAITDGEFIIAARHHHGSRTASLYAVVDPPNFPRATILASERLFPEPAWKTVPEKTLLVVEPKGQLTMSPL